MQVWLIITVIYFFVFKGGGLLICEKVLDEDKRGPKRVLLQSLIMLLSTGGKERTASEYKQILHKHGFIDIQVTLVEDSPLIDAILCRKK